METEIAEGKGLDFRHPFELIFPGPDTDAVDEPMTRCSCTITEPGACRSKTTPSPASAGPAAAKS